MQLSFPILCESQKKQKTVETNALVDSGAGGDFIMRTLQGYTKSTYTRWNNPYSLEMLMGPLAQLAE